MNFVNNLLYIDPGTGSMLATIIIGIVSTLLFAFRNQIIKIKFLFSGGKIDKADNKKMSYVIFSDSKRYWNVFKPVCDEFEKRKINCWFWTASPDDPALEENYEYVKCEFIGEGNKAFARLNIMDAEICLATTPGLDVYQWKRSKNVKYYAHICHGLGEGTGYRMFGMDFFDAVLLTGEYQKGYIRRMEEMRNLPAKDLETVGCTYLDTMLKRYESLDRKDDGSKPFTVLLAPSWGPSSILNRYGEKILKALQDTGYVIEVRPHPQSATSDPEMLEDLKNKFPETDTFHWNTDNDNFDVLSRSDIMITDFSNIVFDYAFIFNKPIIYTEVSFDPAPYDAAWFDEEKFHLTMLPELGKELKESDLDNMKELIDSVSDSEVYKKGRDKYGDMSWKNRGRAAESTVDFLVNKYNELQNNS